MKQLNLELEAENLQKLIKKSKEKQFQKRDCTAAPTKILPVEMRFSPAIVQTGENQSLFQKTGVSQIRPGPQHKALQAHHS